MSNTETSPAFDRTSRSENTQTERGSSNSQMSVYQLDEDEEGESETATDQTEQDQKHRNSTTCPECNGRLIEDAEHGETICQNCGLVVSEEAIDHGPEWRTFENDENTRKQRTGSPTTERMHDKGLATKIGWEDKDANGNVLNSRQRRKMSRLRTWDSRYQTKDATERNVRAGISEIERMGSALGISDDARETASIIFKRAQEERLLLGRSIESVATASLYAAARMAGLPRTVGDVVHVSRIERRPFERAYQCILQELSLAIEPNDPIEFLPQFIDQLDVACSDEYEQTARRLLEDAFEKDPMSGKSPSGLAASALYATSRIRNEPVTQDELSEISDTSNVTIRDGYQQLLDLSNHCSTMEKSHTGPD